MATLTSDQEALLRFIRGEGHPYGQGITSHYGDYGFWDEKTQENQRKLHQACLLLESRAWIYRHYEQPGTVIWMPLGVA